MEFNPLHLRQQLADHGSQWADQNAAASVLEETKSTLKSQIALKFLPDAGSAAKAEIMAEATKEYIDHIKSMVEARRLANRARAQYDSDRAYIELLRSQESTARAMMNLDNFNPTQVRKDRQ
jgi:hypothetical protein